MLIKNACIRVNYVYNSRKLEALFVISCTQITVERRVIVTASESELMDWLPFGLEDMNAPTCSHSGERKKRSNYGKCKRLANEKQMILVSPTNRFRFHCIICHDQWANRCEISKKRVDRWARWASFSVCYRFSLCSDSVSKHSQWYASICVRASAYG